MYAWIKIRGLRFGGVPEWPKGSDCKSDGSAFGGSNPPPSTTLSMLCGNRLESESILCSGAQGLRAGGDSVGSDPAVFAETAGVVQR